MQEVKSRIRNGILILLVMVSIGILIIRSSFVNQKKILPLDIDPVPVAVKVQKVRSGDWKPSVRLFGSMKPFEHFRAIAQVSGEIQWVHPQLKGGAVFKAGEVILKLDPTDYELEVQRASSKQEEIQQRLKEIALSEEQLRKIIETEEKNLELSLKEYHRQRDLLSQETTTKAVLDRAHQTYLAAKIGLDQQRDQLELIPVRKAALEAQLASQAAALKTAKRQVDRTVVSLPFTGRIREFQMVEGQFLSQGQTMFQADGISLMEVHSQISPRKMKLLMGGEENSVAWEAKDLQTLVRSIHWDIRVQLVGSHFPHTWSASLDRIEGGIDSTTRTLGLVFLVEEPWENLRVGKKPPLIVGAHVKVLIEGQTFRDVIRIPRHSLHQKHAYLCDRDSKLEVRAVEVLREHDGTALISTGIQAGENLVLTDLSPAFPGLPLQCVSTD